MYLFGRLTGDIVKTESWVQNDEKERVPYKKNTWLLLKPEMENGRFTAIYDVIASVDVTPKWIGKESINIHPWQDQLKPRYVTDFTDVENNVNSNVGMECIITFDDNVTIDTVLKDIYSVLTNVGFEEFYCSNKESEEENPILQALYYAIDNSDEDDLTKSEHKEFFKSLLSEM